jgi:hypothetical protein
MTNSAAKDESVGRPGSHIMPAKMFCQAGATTHGWPRTSLFVRRLRLELQG